MTVSKFSLGSHRGQAPPSLQREKRGKKWGKQKVSSQEHHVWCLGLGLHLLPTRDTGTTSAQVSHGHVNKQNRPTWSGSQTLKFWDKKARNVFHDIHHQSWFFACSVLKSSFLNCCCPEQCTATKTPLLPILSSASWPGTWTAFVEPGLGTQAAQTENSLENRKFLK